MELDLRMLDPYSPTLTYLLKTKMETKALAIKEPEIKEPETKAPGIKEPEIKAQVIKELVATEIPKGIRKPQ